MRSNYLFLSLLAWSLFWIGCGNDSQKEEKHLGKQVPAYTIGQFMKTESVRGKAISPDESKVLFSSDRTGIFNLFEVPITGGEAKQLTQSKVESIYAISYFPKDERILFTADKGGNELNHIYLRDTNGTETDITPWENARAAFLGWAKDDASFFMMANKRDPRYFDLYQVFLLDLKPNLIFENKEGFDISSVAPDLSRIALTKTYTSTHSDIYIYQTSTGILDNITSDTKPSLNTALEFSNDGTTFYYLSDQDKEFSYLVEYSLGSHIPEIIYESNWDVEYAELSEQETYRVIIQNADARTQIKLIQTKSGSELELPELPAGDIKAPQFSKSEQWLLFFLGSSSAPNDLYSINLGTHEVHQLTHSANPEIDPAHLVEPKVVRYLSFDSLEIPALYYEPHQASHSHHVPGLVWVHGGPGGQSRMGYNPLLQYLVNHGYAVMAVNNRGSSGYGKTFFTLDDQKHGEGDLQDCIYAKHFMAGTGKVDTNRTAIVGGSYGGFMVLAALAFEPEAFDAGVDIFGVSNWLRTLRNIPPYWESYRNALIKEMGHPDKDSTMLKSISPLFHAHQIRKPLMVVQGANDPRVLKVESDEIVEAAKKNGIPVDYIVFEDEGHGFAKKENQQKAYEGILKFLDQYLNTVPAKVDSAGTGH